MIINYFDKYEIDTEKLEGKLKIIEESKTENALYITNVLPKAIRYIFKEKVYNGDELLKMNFEKTYMFDTLICFDSQENDVGLKNFYSKLTEKYTCIIVGNHEAQNINKNIRYVNIKEIRKNNNELSNIKNACIVFNFESIDFSKYYYNKMRNYFLNVIDKLLSINEIELEKDTERLCKETLLDENNFISKCEILEEKLELKDVIAVYAILIKQGIVNKINEENYAFYLEDETVNYDLKNMMLIELSKLVRVCNIKNLDDKFSFIYDDICSKMLEEALNLNYCDFIDDRCVTMRYTKGFPHSKVNGCCADTYKDKNKNCRYLNDDHSCSICSIACRAFTCEYLQKRGIDHALWQYPIMDCTVKKLYRGRIVYDFFIPKEKMLEKFKKCILV